MNHQCLIPEPVPLLKKQGGVFFRVVSGCTPRLWLKSCSSLMSEKHQVCGFQRVFYATSGRLCIFNFCAEPSFPVPFSFQKTQPHPFQLTMSEEKSPVRADHVPKTGYPS